MKPYRAIGHIHLEATAGLTSASVFITSVCVEEIGLVGCTAAAENSREGGRGIP
jgi:hypothetical protein